ncbi:MAG: hypothetical protein ACREIT_00625 [Tepidisphaeraceae bacterium]
MSHRVTDRDIAGYYREGYVVFRRILPGALLRDLRRGCDKAQEIARRVGGPQSQRLRWTCRVPALVAPAKVSEPMAGATT